MYVMTRLGPGKVTDAKSWPGYVWVSGISFLSQFKPEEIAEFEPDAEIKLQIDVRL